MTTDIYLSCGLVRCTEQTSKIEEAAFPTSVHIFEDTYRHAHMGLISPVQRLIDDVLAEAVETIVPEHLETPPDRRATLLTAGNTMFAATQTRKLQPGGDAGLHIAQPGAANHADAGRPHRASAGLDRAYQHRQLGVC